MLPSSGQISLGNLRGEFNPSGSAQNISLGSYYSNNNIIQSVNDFSSPNVPTSGQIKLSEFHGGYYSFKYTPTLGTVTNYNIGSDAAANSNGWWNYNYPLYASVTITGVVGSTSTGLYAFTVPGLPGGSVVNLQLNGGAFISGAGGAGNNNSGGPGLLVQYPINLYNYGTIQSGGVGGDPGSGGNGGGGAGYYPGPGSGTGGTGSLTSGGAGGYDSGKGTANGGPGGGPGSSSYAITGTGYITYVVAGTRLGGIQ